MEGSSRGARDAQRTLGTRRHPRLPRKEAGSSGHIDRTAYAGARHGLCLLLPTERSRLVPPILTLCRRSGARRIADALLHNPPPAPWRLINKRRAACRWQIVSDAYAVSRRPVSVRRRARRSQQEANAGALPVLSCWPPRSSTQPQPARCVQAGRVSRVSVGEGVPCKRSCQKGHRSAAPGRRQSPYPLRKRPCPTAAPAQATARPGESVTSPLSSLFPDAHAPLLHDPRDQQALIAESNRMIARRSVSGTSQPARRARRRRAFGSRFARIRVGFDADADADAMRGQRLRPVVATCNPSRRIARSLRTALRAWSVCAARTAPVRATRHRLTSRRGRSPLSELAPGRPIAPTSRRRP